MSAPGDQVINAPFSLELSRKIYLGNYETETISLRIEFMSQTANQALAQIRSIMDPWIQEAKSRAVKNGNGNNVKHDITPPGASQQAAFAGSGPGPKAKDECNNCGAKLKLLPNGKKDWADLGAGKFAPKNLDGSTHYCQRGRSP